jgi:hypothetical protein
MPSRTSWRRPATVAALALSLAAPRLPAQQPEPVDRAAIAKITDEGMNRSRVMELTSWLTDVYGARLTGAPATKAAAQWAMKEMTGWGLSNVALESWGPFGRGWSSERFSASVVAPSTYPLIAYPGAWSTGTNGPVTAELAYAPIDSEPDFARYAGRLRGKIVLTGRAPAIAPHFDPQARRYSDARLDSMANAPLAVVAQQGQPNDARAQLMLENRRRAAAFAARKAEFYRAEGAVALLNPGRGDGGTVFAQGTGSRDPNAAPSLPTVIVAGEHYGRLVRTLEKGVPVTIELDDRVAFHDEDPNSFNVIAEIPGSDRKLRDEVVMVGAHFDSWHTGTGATDNAAGSAVMMEALRILRATGLPMKRTVRLALWTGEEQGLLGSRAYVKDHFADRETMALKPEHEKLSAYFNMDNGTGQFRGIYQQGNAAVTPIFRAWLAPFAEWGATTQTLGNTGGTDHLAFDAVGLPGFQFIQDPVEYDTRTHHSNQDVYERVPEQDMKRNAVIVASFVYHAANRAEKLPRKELPKAQGAGR